MALKWVVALLGEDGRKAKVPRRFKDEPVEVDAYTVFSSSFKQFFDFNLIHGMTGADSLPILREAVERLGTEGIANYWMATPGNVGVACARLAQWAEQHPGKRWDVKE